MAFRNLLALGLLLVAGCAGRAPGPGPSASCGAAPPTRIALAEARGRPLVPARINGVPVHLAIDTGAGRSSVTGEASVGLELRPDYTRQTLIRGTGGLIASQTVMAESVEFGGRTLRWPSLAVHALPGTEGAQPQVAGLLGADLLAPYEMELDIPNRTLTLREVPAGCPAPEPDWADTKAQPLPVERRGGFFLLRVLVSGKPVLALFDSGANGSSITLAAARRLGVTEAMLAAAPQGEARGADGVARRMTALRFDEVRIGPEAFRGTPLGITDMQLPFGIEMLLGLDYMRTRRFFLSHATGRGWVGRPPAAALSRADAGPAAPPPPRSVPGPPAAPPGA